MNTVTMTYREDPGYGWFTECDSIRIASGGSTLDEARELAIGAARFAGWGGRIIERLKDGTVLDPNDAAVKRGEEVPVSRMQHGFRSEAERRSIIAA